MGAPEPASAETATSAEQQQSSSSLSSSTSPPTAVNPPPVATFATPIGIIEPPPEIKLIIDRTAEFVLRTGTEGEQQLINKNRGVKKFAFLLPSSPYHNYYRQKVNRDTNTQTQHQQPQSQQQQPTALEVHVEKERQLADQQQKALAARQEEAQKTKAEVANKPRTLQQRLQAEIEIRRVARDLSSLSLLSASSALPIFSCSIPINYTVADLEVVKVTALYVSTLGDPFLHSLQQRERSNPQFDFLKSIHPLYPYYSHLVHCYTLIRNRPASLLSAYREQLSDPDAQMMLLLAKARAKQLNDEEEAERRHVEEQDSQAMAQVDWHHFVVVETIEFLPEEEAYLPPPKPNIPAMQQMLAELQLEEEREKEEQERINGEQEEQKKKKQQIEEEEEAEDVEMDGVEKKKKEIKKQKATTTVSDGIVEHKEDDLEILPTAAAAAIIPTASGATGASTLSTGPKLVTCVICGDSIAVEDLEEHLRIELLDPTWKEQKQALMDRNRESSLVAGKSISENLRRLEKKRKESGRERSREEEEKQAREDALLLRTVARDRSNLPSLIGEPSAQSASTTISTAAVGITMSSKESTAAAGKPAAKPLPPQYPAPIAVPPPAAVRAAAAAASGAALFPPGYGPLTMRQQGSAITTIDEDLPVAKKARPASPTPSTATSTSAATAPTTTAPPSTTTAIAAEPTPSKPSFVAETEWLATHAPTLVISLQIPNDPSSPYNLHGQILTFTLPLTATVDALKSQLSPLMNQLGANRMQFNVQNGGFLKEAHSFAYYNLADQVSINLKLKERGGKKK